MKVRIVFKDNRYYVERKNFLSWKKYKRKVTMPSGKLPVSFPSYDEAFQCANDLIERQIPEKKKIICKNIKI